MMLSLLLALTVAAPPSARLEYERKCLYCHSEEVAESRRFTEPQWRRVVEQMRVKAPLLITRGDVARLTRYMAHTLKLVPAGTVVKPAPVVEVKPVVEVVKPSELKSAPTLTEPPPPTPAVEDPSPAAVALEEEASTLLMQRCSKCHTLGRVYGRLDTLERSLQTLERMRLKTGSGITDHDMELLETYLRTQF
jgi:hypothetical protein